MRGMSSSASPLSQHPVRDLGDGVLMPMLGLGVWQVAKGRECEQAVEWALEAGYRHVDTAAAYRNERSVGLALRGGLPRDEVFVTTKWMPVRPNPARELARSLERLGLDYVDLYLVHWPIPFADTRGWKAFEELRATGLARAIGVSNFGTERLGHLLAVAERPPAVNQIQFSPVHVPRRAARLLQRARHRPRGLQPARPRPRADPSGHRRDRRTARP